MVCGLWENQGSPRRSPQALRQGAALGRGARRASLVTVEKATVSFPVRRGEESPSQRAGDQAWRGPGRGVRGSHTPKTPTSRPRLGRSGTAAPEPPSHAWHAYGGEEAWGRSRGDGVEPPRPPHQAVWERGGPAVPTSQAPAWDARA